MSLPLTRWAATLVIFSFCTGLVKGQSTSEHTFVLGSGFLCDSSDSTCPATAKAARGDSYEFSGAGTFDAQDKSVKGAGTFTHKSTSGHVLETGIWTAQELLSFVSYGMAPGALLRERNAFGPMAFDPKPLKVSMIYEPTPTGGLAVFRIRLLYLSGVSRNAALHLNCALGDVPAEHSVEGLQLAIEGNGGEFSESVRGRVIFLATRLGPGPQREVPPASPKDSN